MNDHTYEEIVEGHLKKANSDTDLLRLCGQELEIIHNLIHGGGKKDVTFDLYGQIEQGFYKCHDSIYDVPEGQRIPDLMKKRSPPRAKMEEKQTLTKRRLSLDSGHGTSVASDTSFSSSMPSLKANDLEELNMSDALDRICGTSSLESLPGINLHKDPFLYTRPLNS